MNVLITGGGKGLGKFIAEHLIDKGHKVIVIDKLLAEIGDNSNKKIEYIQLDLSDFNSIEKKISNLIQIHKSIDILINNAAIRNFASFQDFTINQIDELIKVNFQAPILLIHLVLPYMIKNNFGRIINIASVSALSGYSTGSLYCSTKAALYVFTEALASDLNKTKLNITANSILPDSFQTREGVKLGNFNYIINSIINVVDDFIQGNENGRIKVISPFSNKLPLFTKTFYNLLMKFF
ncbi:MAG: SDR family oxidoreductase [Candidatus Woesearchaeota archaeon]